MATDNMRITALQRLDRQEEDNREKRQRSEAYRKAKETEYKEINAEAERAKAEAEKVEAEKQRIKVEYERVFRADMELKTVAQRNATKIAKRRHELDAEGCDGGAKDEELLSPLVLENIPEPIATSRPSRKKAAAQSRSSWKKSRPESDDHQYKPHRKQTHGTEEEGRRSRRLRSHVSEKEISNEPDVVNDEDVEKMLEAEDFEGPDLGERESSAETVLSHITVARKHSKGTTPAAEAAELPSLTFNQQFEQQFEQPGDVGSDEEQRLFEDAMQWINEPLPNLDLFGMPGAPGQQGNLEDSPVEERATSPALSMATSSSSGLFVSERPRRRSSTHRAYREPSHAMPDGGQLHPELILHQSEVFDEADHRTSTLPAELPTLRAGISEDGLFGDTLSEMDIDQEPAQLPTPGPSGAHSHSCEPSERQHSNESGISDSAGLLFVPEDPPLVGQSGGRLGKRHSADASQEEHQEEPAKKKPVKKKSFLEKILLRGR